MEDTTVLVFDDRCATCSLGVRAVQRLNADNSIRYVGMNSPEGNKYVHDLNLDMNASAYLIDKHGTIKEKEAMAASVLAKSGVVGTLLSVPFRIPYVSRFLYTALAWVRFHTTTTRRV
jgi:predicted DCC family thiol-disulfide oxidoreductase YuxK